MTKIRFFTVAMTFCLCMVAFTSKTKAQTWPPFGMAGDGTWSSPYEITIRAHLADLATFVNNGNGNSTNGMYYKLMNDLDLSGYANWTPIGNVNNGLTTTCFQGHFNGDNKIVRNLNINRSTTNYIGLFGCTFHADIYSLGIENANIIGGDYVGGLVGRNFSSLITICHATGNVSGHEDVGGLVGNNYYSSVSICYATGKVSGYHHVGGLVGYNDNSRISNCYATGSVTGSAHSGSHNYVGGLVGRNYDDSSITNCYATGNVSGALCAVGGLVGSNSTSSSISNCYATGSVNGDSYVGGLVGDNSSSSSISNCYAIGNVSGNSPGGWGNDCVGGLVGGSSWSSISNCYAAGNVRGKDYVGGLVGILNNFTIINNCVVASDSVTATSVTTYINRIRGREYESSGGTYTYRNNYALNTMVVQNANGNVTITNGSDADGTAKTIQELQSLIFYNTGSNWYNGAWSIDSTTAIWKICDGKGLPFLRWQGILCEGEIGITPISQNTMLRIFPNPTKSELRIESGDLKIENIQVFDLAGKLVSSFSVPSQSQATVINISHLTNGIYFLKLKTDKGELIKKVIKE